MIKKICLISVFISIFFTISVAYGINTKDWEGILGVLLFGAESKKEWLLKTTHIILKDAFPEKDEKYFEQFFYKDSNSVKVPIPNRWHDLTEFEIFYSEIEQGGYLYTVWYKFKKEVMTVLDVLGRYGYKLADIETKEDLSKEINYDLTSDMPSLIGKNPLWVLQPVKQGHVTILKFISKDKVFVDELIISAYKPKEKK